MPTHEFRQNPVFADHLREPSIAAGQASLQYCVNISLSIGDAGALWGAAASKLSAEGIEAEDLDDMIGPCAAPDVADCLAALLAPRRTPGCRFDDFRIDCAERDVTRIHAPVATTRRSLCLVAKR